MYNFFFINYLQGNLLKQLKLEMLQSTLTENKSILNVSWNKQLTLFRKHSTLNYLDFNKIFFIEMGHSLYHRET